MRSLRRGSVADDTFVLNRVHQCQTGLSKTSTAFKDDQPVFAYGPQLQKILDATRRKGAPDLFLVDAPTIGGAVEASLGIIDGKRPIDVPATLNKRDARRSLHWLVVYLGLSGSSPVRWSVDSVTVQRGVVHFEYHKSPSRGSTEDVRWYYYWVPLGALKLGVYKLELYDTNLKDTLLMRRVEIKSKDQ